MGDSVIPPKQAKTKGDETNVAPKQSHQCSQCDKSFSNKRELTLHQYIHKEKPNTTCGICFRTLPNELSYKRHLRGHAERSKKLRRCQICPASFQTNQELEQHHREAHLSEKLFRCETCGAGFSWQENLRKHQRMHKPAKHECTVCNKDFGDSTSLRVHQRKSHGSKADKSDKPFTCSICKKTFMYDFSYEAHLNSHKLPIPTMVKIVKPKNPNNQTLTDIKAKLNGKEIILSPKLPISSTVQPISVGGSVTNSNRSQLVLSVPSQHPVVNQNVRSHFPASVLAPLLHTAPQNVQQLPKNTETSTIPVSNSSNQNSHPVYLVTNHQKTTNVGTSQSEEDTSGVSVQGQSNPESLPDIPRDSVDSDAASDDSSSSHDESSSEDDSDSDQDTDSSTSQSKTSPESTPSSQSEMQCQRVQPSVKGAPKKNHSKAGTSKKKNVNPLKYNFVMTEDKPFKCDECGLRFRWEVSLNIHKRDHKTKTSTAGKETEEKKPNKRAYVPSQPPGMGVNEVTTPVIVSAAVVAPQTSVFRESPVRMVNQSTQITSIELEWLAKVSTECQTLPCENTHSLPCDNTTSYTVLQSVPPLPPESPTPTKLRKVTATSRLVSRNASDEEDIYEELSSPNTLSSPDLSHNATTSDPNSLENLRLKLKKNEGEPDFHVVDQTASEDQNPVTSPEIDNSLTPTTRSRKRQQKVTCYGTSVRKSPRLC